MQVFGDGNQLLFVLEDKHLWSVNIKNYFQSLINLLDLLCFPQLFKITLEVQPSELGHILIAAA